MKRINVGIISLLVSLTGWAEGYTTEFGVLKSELLGMYIHRDEAENSNIYTSVVAGEINYTTPSWNHLSVTVAPYFSKKIGFLSGSGEDLNYDLLSSERESFIYLGEGYLRYAPQDWDIRIGRLALETPMANADNPRLHRNTHEGVFASYGGIESTTLNVGYIKRWAGYGAPGDFTRFHRFDADETFSGESDGMAMIGIEFQPMEDIGLKGWYFSIDRIADIYTADIEYKAFQSDDTSITLYGQYVEYNEQSGSGYEGQVGGIGIEVEYEPFSFYAAYNHGETKKGKQILAPYGRGPFLVDLEEFTIQEMQSPRAWMLSGGYSISEAFSVELMHGEFKMAPTHSKLSETAGVITYNEDQPVSGRMSYAKV